MGCVTCTERKRNNGKMFIQVEMPSGELITVFANSYDTVAAVKQLISEKSRVPVDLQRLIHAGRIVQNYQTMSDCHIMRGATLRVVYVPQKPSNSRVARADTILPSPQGSPQHS
jgi:hypothetical protein